MTAISIAHVSKTFGPPGSAPVLGDIELEIPEGQFVALLGSSGCGKTTLLRIVGGLETATSGRVSVAGKDLGNTAASRRRALGDVGFVFQEHNLLPWRSALANVLLPLESRGISRAERRATGERMLELVGLGAASGKLPHQLSGGMRQRVAIARALSYDPAVLLMDEPFGALDAQTRDNLNLELQQIWLEKKKTVVFVTHSIQEAVFLADRVVVMQAGPGRVVADVTIDLERPRGIDVLATPEFARYTGVLRDALNHEKPAGGNGAAA
ncbi:ABC transporter ATP-binding protein [Nocardioides pantholopis]|uniref:ABC transporter ATP-binding protein n=1 Tax=Nocardioides pantholopis TaxID=2483798 RepID=UPI000F079B24|nr:ABC transporter ATP-binding protein [Nocardioides pantholopis]